MWNKVTETVEVRFHFPDDLMEKGTGNRRLAVSHSLTVLRFVVLWLWTRMVVTSHSFQNEDIQMILESTIACICKAIYLLRVARWMAIYNEKR